ncbi:MAG: M3 family metallopeptidase [Kiritimatiellae bacterium]|nr:M3 family metallopeptidase [Kiritimatiellia bacterium]
MRDFPDWAGFTPEKAAAELPRLLAEAEAKVSAIEASDPRRYEDFMWALDDATDELWHCWGAISHMLSVMNSDAWRKVQDDFQGKVVAFSLRVGQSKRLYEIADSLIRRGEGLDAVRRRILEKTVQSARHAGVALEGAAKERFNAIQAALARLSADFRNAVIDATTPEIADAAYLESMKHERDRSRREELYRRRQTRAPENASRIDEILSLRREMAGLLGYGSYAELSVDSKCAPGVGAVMDMIDRLDAATRAAEARERAELEETAADTLGSGVTVEPWDVAFCAERLRERRYAYSEEELKRHFEFEKVLAGLFRMAKFLFGVEIAELKGADKPPVWHDDVRFFAVSEGGKEIAHFYLDAFVRSALKSGGAWMNEFRNRSCRDGVLRRTPLATVVLNLAEPENGVSLMPMREVETLFHEFGHALQQMLTRVDEEDAAGVNLVEWDAVEVASQFMENWCLDPRTGIEVPADLKAKVEAARNFRAASACRRQLAFASLDMELHSTFDPAGGATPNDVKNAAFGRFGIPVLPEDGFLNAFSHIFAGGYAAGYYGYKWAEVMSDDCYGAFVEAGLADDRLTVELGGKYRDTILALGGGVSALEAFRRFRGREARIDAHLRRQGLDGKASEAADG